VNGSTQRQANLFGFNSTAGLATGTAATFRYTVARADNATAGVRRGDTILLVSGAMLVDVAGNAVKLRI
jgi:hypothetical protein